MNLRKLSYIILPILLLLLFFLQKNKEKVTPKITSVAPIKINNSVVNIKNEILPVKNLDKKQEPVKAEVYQAPNLPQMGGANLKTDTKDQTFPAQKPDQAPNLPQMGGANLKTDAKDQTFPAQNPDQAPNLPQNKASDTD